MNNINIFSRILCCKYSLSDSTIRVEKKNASFSSNKTNTSNGNTIPLVLKLVSVVKKGNIEFMTITFTQVWIIPVLELYSYHLVPVNLYTSTKGNKKFLI